MITKMKFRQKIFGMLVLSFISLSLISAVPINAFASDSFSQIVGDSYTWEITYKADTWIYGVQEHFENEGDRYRVEITKTNTTILSGFICDTLYGNSYYSTAENQTWIADKTNVLIAGYNSSVGIYSLAFYFTFILPHNATEINSFFDSITPVNYLWTPGLNGYDGTIIMWDGEGYGQFKKQRQDVKYNQDGVMEYSIAYNGTGMGWDLGLKVELLTSADGGIPGFEIFFAVFGVLGLLGTLVLFRNRKL